MRESSRSPDDSEPIQQSAEYRADAPLSGSSLVTAFEARAAELGNERLYTWLRANLSEEATLSYAELRSRALSVCVALRRTWGVPQQGRAMLIYPPGLELLVAFFGCNYAAVIAVPYYPPVMPTSPMPSAAARRTLGEGIDKVARIYASCAPSLLLSTASYLRLRWLSSKLLGAGTADQPTAWPEGWTWRSSDDVKEARGADADWLASWLAARAGAGAGTEAAAAAAAADGGEVSFLQYTSGSTGHPKGVVVRTRNLMANVRALKAVSPVSAAAGAGEPVALVSWLPQYHDMGLIGCCLAPALIGWTADLMSPASFLQRPAAWTQAVSRRAASHSVVTTAPNFGYALCVRRAHPSRAAPPGKAAPPLSLSHWRAALNGAEPIRAATLRAFCEAFGPCGFRPDAFACVFGLAESCLFVAGRTERPHLLRLSRARLAVGARA